VEEAGRENQDDVNILCWYYIHFLKKKNITKKVHKKKSSPKIEFHKKNLHRFKQFHKKKNPPKKKSQKTPQVDIMEKKGAVTNLAGVRRPEGLSVTGPHDTPNPGNKDPLPELTEEQKESKIFFFNPGNKDPLPELTEEQKESEGDILYRN
jgi:hypothetical protein